MSRTTLALVVIGVMIVTGLWWVLVVGGVDEKIAEAETAGQDLELRQAALELQLLQLEDAAQSGGGYARALDMIALSVPAEPEMDRFIEDVKAIADVLSVNLVAIGTSEPRPHTGEPATDVLVIDLDLAVEATFFELLGFLWELEDLDRLVVIDSITVTPGASIDESSPIFDPDVLTVNMTASLFARTSPLVPAEVEG